jgi:hypothetical protein
VPLGFAVLATTTALLYYAAWRMMRSGYKLKA